MDTSPNLALPYIAPSQAQKHVTHNEAIRALDALVQLAVQDRDRVAPPADAADGDRHIVAAPGSGLWAGHDGEIAAFQDGGWAFFLPRPGWLAYVFDEARMLVWDGAAWADFVAQGAAEMPQLGINATADTVNRLAVKSEAILFDHAGTDARMKISKAGPERTASLIMQNNYSGRCELGLAGDDDFRIKVSADGSNWREALRAEAASGEVVIGDVRMSRDMMANVLPDSGRFNGNTANTAFDKITYVAPSYFSAVTGATIASHAKFVHDNSDFGGAAASLDGEVRALVEKIRPAGKGRRYGPEWYTLLITNTSSSLVETRTVSGTTYGLPFANAFTAMPARYSFAYYVKVKSGSALVAMDRVIRASVDGIPVPAGTDASPFMLTNADGWKHICLETSPNLSGYDYRVAQILTTPGGQIWFAMPKLVQGHVNLDPNLGILMNSKMFG